MNKPRELVVNELVESVLSNIHEAFGDIKDRIHDCDRLTSDIEQLFEGLSMHLERVRTDLRVTLQHVDKAKENPKFAPALNELYTDLIKMKQMVNKVPIVTVSGGGLSSLAGPH